jgi:hypothetical protein
MDGRSARFADAPVATGSTKRRVTMVSRRAFLKYTGATALTLFASNKLGVLEALAQQCGRSATRAASWTSR